MNPRHPLMVAPNIALDPVPLPGASCVPAFSSLCALAFYAALGLLGGCAAGITDPTTSPEDVADAFTFGADRGTGPPAGERADAGAAADAFPDHAAEGELSRRACEPTDAGGD